MKPPRALTAACAALILAAATVSCERLEDDAWMKVSFSSSGGGSTLAVVDSALEDESSDAVDVVVTNWSTGSQGTGTGTGINLYRVRVSYEYAGSSFPSYEYGVSAFLPAGETAGSESVTLAGIAIVPLELKEWLLDPAHFPATTAESSFSAVARVLVLGRTSEGVELQVAGSITVAFNSTTQDEEVSAPNTPTGPAAGSAAVGETVSFSTGGASSDLGHPVQYRFDWGDGSTSSWSSGVSANHAWSSPGDYYVKAQARCALHESVTSDWSSPGTKITIN